MPIYQTPIEYALNRAKRQNTLHRIGNGKMYAVLKDTEIPVEEFNNIFPLGTKIRARSDSQKKGNGIGSAGI